MFMDLWYVPVLVWFSANSHLELTGANGRSGSKVHDRLLISVLIDSCKQRQVEFLPHSTAMTSGGAEDVEQGQNAMDAGEVVAPDQGNNNVAVQHQNLRERFPSVFFDVTTTLLLGDPVVDPSGQSLEKEEGAQLLPGVRYYPNRALKSIIAAEVDFVFDHPEHNHATGLSWNRLVPPPPLPDQFYCPITSDLMMEPMISPDGYTFEKEAIENWLFQRNGTCPISRNSLQVTQLRKNLALQECIQVEISKPHAESHPDVQRWREAKAAVAPLAESLVVIRKQLPSADHDPRRHDHPASQIVPMATTTGSAVERLAVAATVGSQRQAMQARINAARRERICMLGILVIGFTIFVILNAWQ
jgi:U-box domain